MQLTYLTIENDTFLYPKLSHHLNKNYYLIQIKWLRCLYHHIFKMMKIITTSGDHG